MKPAKISVIIPVYQVEEYLSECIESVLSQTYSSIEIILIDDGSRDQSPIICDYYARKYSNIQVIHKSNEGQAAARNVGMRAASGEYLMFLDSDDMLADSDILLHMVHRISKTHADILTGNFCFYRKKAVGKVRHHHLKGGAYSKTSEFRFDGFYRFGHLSYPWAKLYRKTFLEKNQIVFKHYPLSEDKLFNMECYLKNAVYDFTDRTVVYYRQRPGTQTSQYYPDFISLWISLGKEYKDMALQCCAPEEYSDIEAFHYFFGSILLIKQEFTHYKKHSLKRAVQNLNKYLSSPPVSHIFHELAKGNYIKNLSSPTWRSVIRIFSILLAHKHCSKNFLSDKKEL